MRLISDWLTNSLSDYDLALLKLEKDIEFSSEISPICLPSLDADYDKVS